MTKLCCSILVYLIYSMHCTGQDAVGIYGARQHYGFIIPHSSELQQFTRSNPWGIQLEWSKLSLSEKAWRKCNCYSQSGVSFTYFNYQDPEHLGSSFNLIFFGEPYLTYKRRLYLSLRAGIGPSWLTKVYDEDTNPDNTFYSSRLSFILLLAGNINYKITDKVIVTGSASYNHISNGGMQQPNKGMNFPTFGIGLSYSPQLVKLPVMEKNNTSKGVTKGYIRLFGTLTGTGKTDNLPDDRMLLIGINGGVMQNLTQTNAISAGLEVWADKAEKEKQRRQGVEYGHTVLAFMIGHNFTFGRLSFNQNLGVYIHNDIPTRDKFVYQRYEIYYRIGKRYQIGSSLKTHRFVADNFDVRLGILF